uniref:7TM_GPCR_Srx domain-containing protein n=1 Tax=Caenorhabditis tropicalis TaxID=1561998 RepID=A0A1I7TJF4_9PELO
MSLVYLKALMCVWGIFWNVLIVAAILKDRVLRNSSTFLLLSLHFFACTIDVGSRLVFDVPSEILNRPLFRLSKNYDDIPTKSFHFTTYSCWFIQLYSLIAIAASHILAVYGTLYYARFTQKKTIIVIVFIVFLSMLSVCYLWSPEFPIIFHPEFWGWTEERNKPLVDFFFYLNYVVQGIVFLCLALTDILIVYKLSTIKESAFSEKSATVAPPQMMEKMQVSVVNSGNTLAPRRTTKVSTELKVSINFIIVSLFLLTQTLIYNICTLYQDNPLCLFLLFIAPIFRGSKCLAYLVSGSALRNAIVNLIMCRKQF